MSDELVKVYDATNAAEAELIREALQEAGIHAYVGNIPSPLDGLTAMGQGIAILVSEDRLEDAGKVIENFAHPPAEQD
jgi:hypothetical protein